MNKFYKNSQNRINIVTFIFLAAWSPIIIKLFYIQIIDHKSATKKMIKNIASYVTVEGSRGIIYDKNSISLSQNINKYTVWVNSNDKNLNNESINKIALELSKGFSKDKSYYLNKLKKKSNYIVLEKNISEQKKNILSKVHGLNIDKSISRFYPYQELASQLIGYTDQNNNGKIGIEAKFDHILSGSKANKLLSKKKGIYSNHINNDISIKKGADITLTIDINIQTILQDELQQSMIKTGAKSANGVIIDPFSGNILAMASLPSIDLNNYQNYPISNQRNKVISDIYEPGSTYKIVTMAGKLELLNEFNNDEYYCENGKYLYYDKVFHDHEGHENLSLMGILSHSSNIGMVKIADEIGKNNIYKFTRLFGFGSPTGIPLIGESYGILKPTKKWSGISAPEIAIGQEIAINNLQLGMAYCAIANGGFLIKPKIIDRIFFNDNNYYIEDTKVIRQVTSYETSNELLEMLRDAIINGTGQYANIKGFDIAGKTGTAQKVVDGKYSKDSFVSSFAAIFPSKDPKYVCIVSIDSADYSKGYHWAGVSVAPVIKNIFERIIHTNEVERYNDNLLIVQNSSELVKG